MTDDLVFESLIDYYKGRGIDLHFLLDNPIFMALSLDSRVNLLKKYAREISDGTPDRSMSRRDVKRVLSDAVQHAGIGAAAGYFGAKGATKFFTHGRPDPASVAVIAAASGVFGGIGSLLGSLSEVNKRREIAQSLENFSTDPTDRGAIGIMAQRHLQGSFNPLINAISPLKQLFGGGVERFNRFSTEGAHSLGAHGHFQMLRDMPHTSKDYTAEEYSAARSAAQATSENLKDPFRKPT